MIEQNLTSSTAVVAPPATVTTLFGGVIPGSIEVNGHSWVADANGLYHTATDLKVEWTNFETQMLSGHGDTLTAIQRLEGNAEMVFDNTGLHKLDTSSKASDHAKAARDREDVQREYDAMGAAMATDGYDPAKPFTEQSYLAMERAIRSSATLQELGIQGHGLNNPPSVRYAGYTNDFQNNVDQKTLYVGGGLDHNERALADFFDDVVLSHAPFPTVFADGHLEQLNQNGNDEDQIRKAVVALSDVAYFRTLTAADFSKTAATAPDTYVSPAAAIYDAALAAAVPAGMERTLTGDLISTTIVAGAHTWVADNTGLYHTATDLKAEWQGFYLQMLEGHGGSLTAVQRLEGNAEAVFENTGLYKQSAANRARDREDVQRELDAIDQAMRTDHIAGPFTQATYLQMENTIQDSAALEQLAIQGHGLNNPPSSEYRGYTNDFQNNVDNGTKYVGGGLNNGQRAIADFFDDNIITHAPFPVVFHNGRLEQYNQDGDAENTLAEAVGALNRSAFQQVLVSADFSRDGTAHGPVVSVSHNPANDTVTTLSGEHIAGTLTIGAHVWVADDNGLYHTATNLKAEWQGYYATMLAGHGASLTAEQRAEGNAEAVFENTGLKNLSAVQQQIDREDAQREFDVIGQAMHDNAGSFDPTKPFTVASYLALEHTIQNSAALEELGIQGHGLNHPVSPRYRGYTNDFQNNVDQTTKYVGPGANHNERAVAALFDDAIMTHVPFAVVWQNGHQEQLNQNGNPEDTVAIAVADINLAEFGRTFLASDFKA